jgi:transposase
MEDMISMSKRESQRRDIVAQVLHGKLKQTEAAVLMHLSYRQTNRIIHRYRHHGVSSLIHQNRGKPSSRKIAPPLEQNIIALYRAHYPDFGPTFACEKLLELHQICISRETLRQMLIRHDLFKPRKQREQQCHPWRQRKAHAGELIQVDGSHHRWLEHRLDQEFCLMAYIDDATGHVFARFYEYEGTMPFLDSLQRYINQCGIPQAFYLDRHSTYCCRSWSNISDTNHIC